MLCLTKVSQGLVDTMRRQTLPRQCAHIVDLITILWKNVSNRSERKRRKLARLVLHLTKIRIVQLGNPLDTDLKIIWSQNVPSHLKTVRKDASLKNPTKKVIVHATTAMMTTNLRYMNLWNECLLMTNAKVKTMATVRNWPIIFWIQELRAIWRHKLRTSFQDH